LKTRQTTQAAAHPEIDWTHLSRQDKDIFFSWLDEFFLDHRAKGPPQSDDQSVVSVNFHFAF
jgi:hypothetical protein